MRLAWRSMGPSGSGCDRHQQPAVGAAQAQVDRLVGLFQAGGHLAALLGVQVQLVRSSWIDCQARNSRTAASSASGVVLVGGDEDEHVLVEALGVAARPPGSAAPAWRLRLPFAGALVTCVRVEHDDPGPVFVHHVGGLGRGDVEGGKVAVLGHLPAGGHDLGLTSPRGSSGRGRGPAC
jgi:hypothetical protein